MEKSELIELLKGSQIGEFNRYREEHPLTGARPYINLSRANLSRANLTGANLLYADLSHAGLSRANLKSVDLRNANLSGAYLQDADLTDSRLGWTVFASVDLSTVKGLESVIHITPSTIGIDTIKESRGQIPEPFLKGCGMSDWEIEMSKCYRPDISISERTDIYKRIEKIRNDKAIQINPLFISYSHTDGAFVDALETLLNDSGIRFWRDTHDATAGRLEKQIDHAIRQNPTVLVILSEHSVKSDWVEHEVRLARKLEIETGRDALCPIALDDSWKTCRWPQRIREQIMEYNILDFSAWQAEQTLQQMYRKLIDGLDLFYKA